MQERADVSCDAEEAVLEDVDAPVEPVEVHGLVPGADVRPPARSVLVERASPPSGELADLVEEARREFRLPLVAVEIPVLSIAPRASAGQKAAPLDPVEIIVSAGCWPWTGIGRLERPLSVEVLDDVDRSQRHR
jgi:hypothetical protein